MKDLFQSVRVLSSGDSQGDSESYLGSLPTPKKKVRNKKHVVQDESSALSEASSDEDLAASTVTDSTVVKSLILQG